MPITSCIIRTVPGAAGVVAATIAEWPGIEIHGGDADRIVVILDTAARAQDRSLWDALQLLDGVLAVDAIYHNAEDLACEETPTHGP